MHQNYLIFFAIYDRVYFVVVLSELGLQVHLFFIAFPFVLKCLNSSFWKYLGICLLMKTGLPAYRTSK